MFKCSKKAAFYATFIYCAARYSLVLTPAYSLNFL